MSTNIHPTPKKMEGPGEDFRPPWVYVGSGLVSWAVIPGIVLYSVFLYDFGDQEHVFQAPRRWARRKINSFFTLSPAEEKLLLLDNQQSNPADTEETIQG
ncbi:hypothetical protein JR316_0007133 [Psilocybe cubensis]|uniref:Uncharacterized protein n=2 Tax=Psilocybe cubensis TaxID=181762 RepID=A0ACB8GY20_PSICU|nr:hypothetical protein JR316_0007133 [Psilocybe cubensis]KAH9480533.1 hypothetical protein JR316_0007133 [Psilocybe cubensis]